MQSKINSFSGEYRFLSNFWPVNIVFEGMAYPSTEHAYQASKTTDYAVREIIAKMETASKAKKLGQEIQKRPDWNDEMRILNMTTLVNLKFSIGNPDLVLKLIDTGNAEIIEGNTWNDTFFGVCNDIGENHLGKILMETRKKWSTVINAIKKGLTNHNGKRKKVAEELQMSERTLYRYIQLFKLN